MVADDHVEFGIGKGGCGQIGRPDVCDMLVACGVDICRDIVYFWLMLQLQVEAEIWCYMQDVQGLCVDFCPRRKIVYYYVRVVGFVADWAMIVVVALPADNLPVIQYCCFATM